MNKQEPVRVLQMIASLFLGGSQTVVMNLYKNIDRSKVQFDFIIDHDEYDQYRSQIEELGGNIYVMPSFNGKNILEVKKAWNDFFANHPEYKILHSHSRSYASIYFPIAKKHGVKTIIHSHSTGNGYGAKAFIKDCLQYPLRFQADYFFACTKQAGKWLFGSKVIGGNRFFVLNNAVDTSRFKYNKEIRDIYRKEFKVEDKKVLIQVGNFVPEKNHIFSVELLSKLLKQDDNYILYFVGDGICREKIEKKIEELGLKEKAILLGFRKDVDKLLQMADYYLMPSLFEGLSLAAIEAQTSGINCLLSDTVDCQVKVSDNCKMLPIDLTVWENEIAKISKDRSDQSNDVTKAGFDIKTTSKWLMDFYLRIINE